MGPAGGGDGASSSEEEEQRLRCAAASTAVESHQVQRDAARARHSAAQRFAAANLAPGVVYLATRDSNYRLS